jgi:hypothetical protein
MTHKAKWPRLAALGRILIPSPIKQIAGVRPNENLGARIVSAV